MAPVPHSSMQPGPHTYSHATAHPRLPSQGYPPSIKNRMSKRGANGNALADAVVPHHSHGPGGMMHLKDPVGNGVANGGGPAGTGPGGFSQRVRPRSSGTLEDIARRVRAQSDRFQQALIPAAESIKVFAESSPVLFTFVAIFVALSLIPTVIFIGFVTAVSVFSTGVSAILLSFSVAGTIMVGLTFLLPVLAVTGTISVLCVSFLLCVFLAHRLYLHLTQATEHHAGMPALLAGISTWWDETRARVGLGSYRYGVTAFEDYKAYGSPGTQPPAPLDTPQQSDLKPPRIVYEAPRTLDYTAMHPQPTPSFPGRAESNPVKEEPVTPERKPVIEEKPETDFVEKPEHYEGEWTSESEAEGKKI